MAISQHKADKLGRRLRHADVPSIEDLRLLGEYRDEHLEAMTRVFFGVARMHFPRLALSARQKNANTIVEKLRTEPNGMALSRMQDIAGVRVIVSGRLEQDDAVKEVSATFDLVRVSDRIEQPHAGYRAMHVIVEVDGRLVEVQVRTALQNRWAQAFERLGDHWGRQIRRGEPPNDPDLVIKVMGAPVTRNDVVRYMQNDVSPEIAEAEQLALRLASLRRRYPMAFEPSEQTRMLRRDIEELEDFAKKRLMGAEGMIHALHDLQEMVPASVDAESQIHGSGGAAQYYLVGYRRTTGRLVVAFPCADSSEVLIQRRALEEKHRKDPDFEVVLLASQSEADLRRTHARYFEGLVELAADVP